MSVNYSIKNNNTFEDIRYEDLPVGFFKVISTLNQVYVYFKIDNYSYLSLQNLSYVIEVKNYSFSGFYLQKFTPYEELNIVITFNK